MYYGPAQKRTDLICRTVVRHLTILFVLGLVLRMIVAQAFLGGLNRPYDGDEADYVRLATDMVNGLGFLNKDGTPTSFWSPGLPLILAIPVALLGSELVTIRTFMCFVEALLSPACYLLARSVTGSQKIGLAAGVIAIFFPTWLMSSGAILTDILGTVLIILMVWSLIEAWRRRSLSWFACAGIIWGVATLFRAEAPIYGPGILLWLWLVTPEWKKSVAATAAVLMPFAFIIALWSIRNTSIHGAFVLTSTQGGSELYKSNNAKATGILAYDNQYFNERLGQLYSARDYPNEAVRSGKYQTAAVDFILANPRRFVELCFIRFMQFWKLYSPRVPLINNLAVIGSFGITLPFFLIQAGRTAWKRGPEMLLVFVILSHTAAHVVFTSIIRYRIPVEPLVIILAIQGFYWAFGRIGHRVEEGEEFQPVARSSSV